MNKQYFKNVYYRMAAAVVSTLTKGGSYPDYTFSGWTALVGAVADKAKLGLEADGKDPMGDGTERVSGEKIPLEIPLREFTGANYATIRSAFLNQKVDVLFLDPEQPTVAFAAFGVRAYPAINITGGEDPVITLQGERKTGAAISGTPFQIIAVS
jgi:hypothetical protein